METKATDADKQKDYRFCVFTVAGVKWMLLAFFRFLFLGSLCPICSCVSVGRVGQPRSSVVQVIMAKSLTPFSAGRN